LAVLTKTLTTFRVNTCVTHYWTKVKRIQVAFRKRSKALGLRIDYLEDEVFPREHMSLSMYFSRKPGLKQIVKKMSATDDDIKYKVALLFMKRQ
jgi:hypothetical protein